MKSRKIFTTLSIVVILLTSPVLAGIPSPLKDVKVSAGVNYDRTSGIFTYNYEVYNPPVNTSQIFSFDVDITSKPGDVTLSNEGLFNGPCYHKYTSEDILRQVKVVPVGIDAPTAYMEEFPEVTTWNCGPSISGFTGWGSRDDPYNILPGQKLKGFTLTSYGLPAIRDAIAEPAIDYDSLPDEYYENVELTKQLQDSLVYRTKTLGPTAPPADFKPLDFLNHIISMKHEAFQLGWIKNAGIENSLDKKLESAKKSLEKGSTTSAKNILSAFVNEVEAQGCPTYDNCPEGKHLTPEAYGLLKYNAEYLMEKL